MIMCRCCGTTLFRDERTARDFKYRRARFFGVCGRSQWVPPYQSVTPTAVEEAPPQVEVLAEPARDAVEAVRHAVERWTICLACFRAIREGAVCGCREARE